MANGTSIDYNNILNTIKTELYEIINGDSFYANHDFLVTLEQQFIKTRQMQPNRIYIVVKISSASVNYGQTVLPVTIQVVSEQNMLFTAQKLLFDFVSRFNLARSTDQTTQQIWESPVVSTNFEQMFEGFRSVLYVSGTLVISQNANFYTLSYNVPTLEYTITPIDFIPFSCTLNNSKVHNQLYNEEVGGIQEILIKCLKDNEWFINGEKVVKGAGYSTVDSYMSGKYGITRNVNYGFLKLTLKPSGNDYVQASYETVYCLINEDKAFQRLYQENTNNITEAQNATILYNGISTGEWKINGQNITMEMMNKYGYDDLETFMSDYYGITRISDGDGLIISLDMSFTLKQMDILGINFGGDSQLDPQVFYNTHNFTESIAKVGTITLGISSYLFSDNELMNTCLAIQLKDIDKYPLGINTTFKLTIAFKNGMSLTDNFKMASLASQQNLGEIPSVSLTFTN